MIAVTGKVSKILFSTLETKEPKIFHLPPIPTWAVYLVQEWSTILFKGGFGSVGAKELPLHSSMVKSPLLAVTRQ